MIRDGDPRYKRIDEYEFWDTVEKRKTYRCIGCKKEVSFREFEDNKGYCANCRDGKNDHLYPK